MIKTRFLWKYPQRTWKIHGSFYASDWRAGTLISLQFVKGSKAQFEARRLRKRTWLAARLYAHINSILKEIEMDTGQNLAIEFRNVSISFEDVQALQNISFTLRPGEMICVTGDSASGKSVLLRLALGFLRPDEGQVLIDGRDITAMDEEDLLPLRSHEMGMVFQENSFFSGQTVYENTAYR